MDGAHKMNQFRSKSSISGFSLAELLVSIVIIAILASISLGTYISTVKRQANRSASLNTAEWLDNIRKRAIQQNQPCTVSISTSLNTLFPSTSNLCGSFPTLDISESSTGGSKPRFCYFSANPLITSSSCSQSSTSSTNDIVLSPRGTTTNQALFEFYILNDSPTSCAILLSPLGIIRSGTIKNGSCNTRS